MKISAVIITFNEERNIKRCLKSLQGVVDEIVVVDSFSADDTKGICQTFGVVFEQTEWKGYSETKNFANSLASNEFILSIDADESLSPELRESLLELKDSGQNKKAYEFNRLTNYCGQWVKHCGWYPDKKIRVFPKEVKWKGEIHEELLLKGLEIEFLKGDLYHYSYYNHKEHRERADKYSRLTARKMFEQGKRSGILKPLMSGIAKFISIYFLKLGILDGKAGWYIAKISAQSNIYKYKELRRLQNG